MAKSFLPIAVINTFVCVDLLADARFEVVFPAALIRHWRFFVVAFANVFIDALSMSQLDGCYKHFDCLLRP